MAYVCDHSDTIMNDTDPIPPAINMRAAGGPQTCAAPVDAAAVAVDVRELEALVPAVEAVVELEAVLVALLSDVAVDVGDEVCVTVRIPALCQPPKRQTINPARGNLESLGVSSSR
jgi:hypothetical protein